MPRSREDKARKISTRARTTSRCSQDDVMLARSDDEEYAVEICTNADNDRHHDHDHHDHHDHHGDESSWTIIMVGNLISTSMDAESKTK